MTISISKPLPSTSPVEHQSASIQALQLLINVWRKEFLCVFFCRMRLIASWGHHDILQKENTYSACHCSMANQNYGAHFMKQGKIWNHK
jgi:hypothetical protein